MTWSLAMDLADQIAPAGFARPVLVLAALLDPAGIPGVVFTSQAACGYMTGHPAMPGDPAQARDAVHDLARAGLVTINPASTTRTVQVHPLIQALTRKVIPAAEFERAARSAADALLAVVARARGAAPAGPGAARLHDPAARLHRGPAVDPGGPPGAAAAPGESLSSDEISGPATAYWQAMLDTATRVLGPAHAQTLRCRDGLAAAYEAADRLDDAIGVHERTLAERQRALGNDHPDTLASCAHLGRVYAAAGRHGEALPMYERVVADREWVLGARHPETLAARGDLAAAYLAAGPAEPGPAGLRADPGRPGPGAGRGAPGHAHRPGRAGPRVPDGGPAQAGRPGVRADPGRTGEGAGPGPSGHHQRPRRPGLRVPDRGPDEAGASRSTSGWSADRERVLGTYHPDTLTARGNLANAYLAARRLKDALPVYERTLADREMAQGADDVDTLTARGNLANAYHSAGRLKDALPLYEQTLVDCERVLGPTHQATLTSRANLALRLPRRAAADRGGQGVRAHPGRLRAGARPGSPADPGRAGKSRTPANRT